VQLTQLRTRQWTALTLSATVATFLALAATPSANAGNRPTASDFGVTGDLKVIQGANAQPMTIPSLRHWTGGSGTYTFGPGSRIIVGSDAARPYGRRLADDLQALTGTAIPVVTGPPAAGEIALQLTAQDPVDHAEGYSLTVTDHIVVSARESRGLFYGTRTVLQLIAQDDQIPQGTATDWPTSPERSVMVDVGRKFMSIDWLKNLIRELSYLKYSNLHLHLSDDLGFRLKSERYPYITSPDHYSRQDIKELVDFADQHKIRIVPEIDMPGHMGWVLARYAEQPGNTDLRLARDDGTRAPDKLDLTRPAAWDFATDLVSEFMPWFTGDSGAYFHIGTDEWTFSDEQAEFTRVAAAARERYRPDAVPGDFVIDFANHLNDVVKRFGRTTRAWDQLVGGELQPDADIVLDSWTDSGVSPAKRAAQGHHLLNVNNRYLYYSLSSRRFPDSRTLFEAFSASEFRDGSLPAADRHHLGVGLAAWFVHADAESPGDIARFLSEPLRPLAQKAWGPNPVSTWEEYTDWVEAVGHAPGYSTAFPENLAEGRPVTVSGQTSAHPAEHAVDGQSGTWWQSSPGATQELTVDLGTSVTVDRAVARFRDVYPTRITVEVSSDGQSWTDVFTTGLDIRGPSVVADPLTSHITGRYVRLSLVASSAPELGYQLYEFEVFGSIP
jgi:hexosaminidase